MRNKFDEQLELLNAEMINMGALCEEAIALSVKAMKISEEADPVSKEDSSDELRKRVYLTDDEIDRKEKEIEALCMKLLLCQQPVAGDLRIVSSALKMISDMERIGDQASDIAELTEYIRNSNIKYKSHINDMAKEAIKMVTDSIESFVKKDIDLAGKVIAYDDVVDDCFVKIKRELIEIISKDIDNGEAYIDLLMIAKYLERIGDHATNIAEWVEYSITGVHRND